MYSPAGIFKETHAWPPGLPLWRLPRAQYTWSGDNSFLSSEVRRKLLTAQLPTCVRIVNSGRDQKSFCTEVLPLIESFPLTNSTYLTWVATHFQQAVILSIVLSMPLVSSSYNSCTSKALGVMKLVSRRASPKKEASMGWSSMWIILSVWHLSSSIPKRIARALE